MVFILQDSRLGNSMQFLAVLNIGNLYQIGAHATLFYLWPLLESPVAACVNLGTNHQPTALHLLRFLLVLLVYGHPLGWFLIMCNMYFIRSVPSLSMKQSLGDNWVNIVFQIFVLPWKSVYWNWATWHIENTNEDMGTGGYSGKKCVQFKLHWYREKCKTDPDWQK